MFASESQLDCIWVLIKDTDFLDFNMGWDSRREKFNGDPDVLTIFGEV